jgi:hypothetical protein
MTPTEIVYRLCIMNYTGRVSQVSHLRLYLLRKLSISSQALLGFPQYSQKSTELELVCSFRSLLSDMCPRLCPVRSGDKGGRKERRSYHIVPRLHKLCSFLHYHVHLHGVAFRL